MLTPALQGLTDLAHDRTTRDGLLAQLEVARRRLEELQRTRDEAVGTLATELEDVTRLESMSMTRILASLRGRRDLDLDQERAEAEAARYAAAEAEARRASAQQQVAVLEARVAELGDLDARRTALLEQRAAEVAADPAAAETAARLDEVAADREQVEEALMAAGYAQRALTEAAAHLGGAGDWATFDTFFGGGVFTDMAKYDRLDRAAVLMRDADAALDHLATELADVGMREVGGIDISQLTGFFDVWFDNIFSDWAVRDRIRRAAQRVAEVQTAVQGTAATLHQRLAACDDEVARLTERREELLGAR
jgi:hypothetical protein